MATKKAAKPSKPALPANRQKTGRGGTRSTSFKPGQSGNPSGRPKKTEEERTLEVMCREKTPEALGVVLDLMANGEQERTRLAAAQLVIERGHGKAIERVISDNHTTIEDRRVQGADEILARALAGGKNGSDSGVGSKGPVLPAAVRPQSTRH